jgi:hypothetical protein
MAVSLELEDFDKTFNSLKAPPLIVNDIVDSSLADKESLKSQVFTRYDSDLMKNVPSCDCGAIAGAAHIGILCNNCNTVVVDKIEKDLEPILWVRAPKGVEKLINPMVWIQLSARFKKSNFNAIEWICDTSYRASQQDYTVIKELQESGIERGYNYFVQNFYEVITKLMEMRRFASRIKSISDPLMDLLVQQKHAVFSNYLPLVNRTLLVIEETNVGTYVDPFVPKAIDAILTVASIDTEENKYTQKVKENRTVKFIIGLANYYQNFIKQNLGSKQGIFRQHTYGSRANFSFRSVVTSMTDAHTYDEIHIPWGVGISVFRYHITNKLLKRGYTVNDCINLLNSAAKSFNVTINEIFKELIEESPRKGIDATLNRNPSLARGSIQRVRITAVKEDPSITTISFSILIVTPLNADFDGKALPSLNSSN